MLMKLLVEKVLEARAQQEMFIERGAAMKLEENKMPWIIHLHTRPQKNQH